MATFQDVRKFLEENRDELAVTLDANDAQRFQTALSRLQHDWDQIPDDQDQAKLTITLREMGKYPAVLKELENAGLVAPEPSILPTTQPVPDPARAPKKPEKPVASPEDNEHTYQPSQNVTDRIALWDKKIAIGKELMTGALGALIVLVTLGVAIAAIFSVSNPSTYGAAKDILLYMNALVGVVLGYYFGRVPGDVRADKAEREAKTANRERERLSSTVRGILDSSSSSTRGVNDSINLTAAQVAALRRVLNEYDR